MFTSWNMPIPMHMFEADPMPMSMLPQDYHVHLCPLPMTLPCHRSLGATPEAPQESVQNFQRSSITDSWGDMQTNAENLELGLQMMLINGG